MKKMKKLSVFVCLFTAAVLSACVTRGGAGEPSLDEAIEQSAAAIADKLPAGTRVAVVAFESPHGNLSGYIMDEIAGALVDGNLEVADRNNLEYVYQELGFQMSGDMDDESAQSIGKFLGARYVVTGQLVDTGGRYRYRLNGINVETAIHESSTRLDVRNDRRFQEMIATLQKAAPVVRTASYGGASGPKTAGTFLDRGIGFASRGEYDLAIADFTEALKLDPDLQAETGKDCPVPIDAMAVASLGESVVCLDENGKSLAPSMLTGDCRGIEEAEWLSRFPPKMRSEKTRRNTNLAPVLHFEHKQSK